MDATERPSFAIPLEVPAEPVVPRQSSTVLVVRDGATGMEVFMLERALKGDFLGGAYVFPGGTLDAADADPTLGDVVDGLSADVVRALGHDALALVVCAIRETFEEAGILLARHEDGTPVRLTDDERWGALRAAINAREMTALELARAAKVRFAADWLRFWGRLITPLQAPRRYDTRFFLAHMPDGQDPLHDDIETSASVWVRPVDAVARGRSGELSIIYPTRKTLESIADFGRAGDAFAAAWGRPSEGITPRVVFQDGEPRIELPDGSMDLP